MDRRVLLMLVMVALLAIAAASRDDSLLSRLRRNADPARTTAPRESTPRGSTSRTTSSTRSRATTASSGKSPRIIHGPLAVTATEDHVGAASEQLYDVGDDAGSEQEQLETAAQSPHHSTSSGGGNRRHGYSGTVVDGKSSYIMRYNQGVPIYGAGEPYYFSYTHNFPISVNDFENLVNSHNLPKKYKFSGGLDVTGLLEDHDH